MFRVFKDKINQIKVFREFNKLNVRKVGSVHVFVFSKDRPLQLYALLESFHKFDSDNTPITIIYSASNQNIREAYQDVINTWPNDDFVEESSFRQTLIDVVGASNASRILFLVDDIIFTNEIKISEFDSYDLQNYVPSLRLGRNIVYSYTRNKNIDQPEFEHRNNHLIWSWSKRNSYWSYPLSVDGHMFYRDEMMYMLQYCVFKAPNSLEEALQFFFKLYKKRKGVCSEKSVIVNIPWNVVQSEFENIHGDISYEVLLKHWQDGYKIDIMAFHNVLNNSCHTVYPLSLIKRGTMEVQ